MTDRERLTRILIAGALLIGAFLLGSRSGSQGEQEREWRTSAGIAVKAGKPFRDSIAKLSAREAQLMATVRNTRARVDSVLVTVSKDSIPESLLLVLADQSLALDQCTEAVTACQLRATWASQRADSLEAQLRKGLYITKCNILILPCPSRGLAFLGGAVVGGLLSGVLK